MRDWFTLVWSFRNRIDVLKQSIETAHKYCPINVDFCLIDAASDDETIRELREFCNSIEMRKIRICESTYRSSLSEAWNLGMMLTENRYVMFLSSDTVFVKGGWFEALSGALNDGLEYVLVENHALFGFDKMAIPKMGWFDEGYVIGPHFDTDYMIRASENGIKFGILPNQGYYKHGDTPEESKQRQTEEVKDRLPMNHNKNDIIFKDKWETSWDGWGDRKHPPTHISQVKRKRDEVDPHPYYTRKYK